MEQEAIATTLTSHDARAPPLITCGCYLKFDEEKFMDILEKLLFDLELSGFGGISQKNYLYHIGQFAKYCQKPLQDTDINDVRKFLHHLQRSKKFTAGSVTRLTR